jgi:hypothetical protein
VIKDGFSLNFSRAAIDNDTKIKELWQKAGLNSLKAEVNEFNVKQNKGNVTLLVRKTYTSPSGNQGFNTTEKYTISGNNEILLETKIEPYGKLPYSLPRIGYELHIHKNYSQVKWYGKGSGHSYADKKEGMKTGIFMGTVEEQFFNFPKPQENGNKSELRWMSLSNEQNKGIKITADHFFNASILKYSTQNIAEAKHPYDLKKLPYTVLNIDFAQGPIGNQSCGPQALERYWVKPDAKNLNFLLTLN